MPSKESSSADQQRLPAQLLPFSGCNIMVVEDEFLIADDIAAMLREAGANIIGPAGSLPEGMRLAGDTAQIDAAVLNIDLNGVTVFPLADELMSRGVRIMFMTGYAESEIPQQYSAVPCCRKPVGAGCVIEELKALLRPVAA